MKNRTKLSSLTIFLIAFSNSNANQLDQPDCRGSSMQETANCMAPYFQKVQSSLDKELTRVIGDMNIFGNKHQKEVASLEKSHELWEQYIDLHCTSVTKVWGGVWQAYHFDSCKNKLTLQKINELKQWNW